MVCFIKKVLPVCCVSMICLMIFSGCATLGNRERDWFSFGEKETEKNGVSLSTSNVNLELDPEEDSIQVTKDFILTNTKQIIVSVDNIQSNTKIELYLYTAESLDNPIGYATLSTEEKEIAFTNLTSAVSYIIGATVSNSSSSVTLTISD